MYIKYCVFPLNVIFLNSDSSAAVLDFDLPLCTLPDTEGKPREARFRYIYYKLRKNTIFNEHPVTDLVDLLSIVYDSSVVYGVQ